MYVYVYMYGNTHTITPLPLRTTLTSVVQWTFHNLALSQFPLSRLGPIISFLLLFQSLGPLNILDPFAYNFFHPHCQSLTPLAHSECLLYGILPVFRTNSHSDLKRWLQ